MKAHRAESGILFHLYQGACCAVFVLAVLALSGCASMADFSANRMDNRIACTVAKDKLYALSEWGPVSFGARISDLDRAAVCR